MTTPTTVQARFQLRADTAANWTSVNPVLLNNEFGLETDTKKLKVGNGSTAWNSLAYFPTIVSGGTVLGNLEIGTTGTLTFEGSTADGFETTLAVANPTADRTITLPNQSGNVIVSGNASIVNADISASAAIAFSKLASMTAGYVLIGNASNVPTVTQVTGDVTISSSGVTSIASGVIVDADVSASAEIAVSKLADGAARQLLQTDAAGTGVEWTDNVDIPGTLDVTGAATFDGAVTIAGDLTVNGTTTNINTQNLVVEDKNVILGDVATPTDVTADGGGITLKGSTDKTINWVDATDAWTSSERFSIPAGTAGAPSLTITGDENTGIYSPGADQLGFSTGGTGRMFINASGNIGVGTSSPGYALTVQGGTASINVKDPDDTTSPRVVRYIFSFSDGDGASINATRVAAGAASNAYLTFRTAGITNAEERLRIASDGFISLGGDADTGFSNPAANNLAFSTGGSERARIDDFGRLLIGTSSNRTTRLGVSTYNPRLQIEAESAVASFSVSRFSSDTSSTFVNLQKGRGSIASPTAVVSGDNLGAVVFSGFDGTNLTNAAYILAAVDGTPGADDMPGRLVFSTTADGASGVTERMRINSSGQVLIGKTAGSYTSTDTQFEVAGGIQSNIGIGNYPYWSLGPVESITIVNGGSGYTDGTYTAIPLLTNGIAEGVAADFTVSGGVITAVTVAREGRPETNRIGDALTLQTSTDLGAGGTGLSLTTASVRTAYFGAYYTPGRIRLGNNDSTISANQELGSILFSQRDASSVGGILYGGAGDTARIYARAAGTSGGGYFDFWTANNGGQARSQVVFNYDASNSIITINNPGDSSAGQVCVLRAEQATATTGRRGGQIVFGRENANSWAASTTDCDGYIAFSPVLDNTNTERMRITSAGLVGIGTSVPVTQTHIVNNGGVGTPIDVLRVQSEGAYFNVKISPAANPTDAVTTLTAYSAGGGNSNNSAFAFNTRTSGTESEKVRIDSSGRVGIGTTSPGSLLSLDQTVTRGALTTTAPGRLYAGTGTITDNTTATSGTAAHGTIVAFDNPAIAATNTGVIYTNASTVYIDGAPTASTNVTITNPYALYVNAGTSFFGGNVNLSTGNEYRINNTKVVGARVTGWGAATGTATRTTFATSTVTTAQLAERVKALIDDLITHGLIGA